DGRSVPSRRSWRNPDAAARPATGSSDVHVGWRPRSAGGVSRQGHRSGMDTPLATARILRFLEQEPVVWLSTVRPDGVPHLVPIWFWWDGEALLVVSKPNAQKVLNLRANP